LGDNTDGTGGRAAADRVSSCLSLDSNWTALYIYDYTWLHVRSVSILRKIRCAPGLPRSNRCAVRVSFFIARFLIQAFTCKTMIKLTAPIIPHRNRNGLCCRHLIFASAQ